MTYTLEQFEHDALPTLVAYGAIECISPAFESNWQTLGHINAAAELLAEWARSRELLGATVASHQMEGRTPVITVDVPASDPLSDGTTTVLYGHLDKQPPLGNWSDGLHPFRAVRRGDQLFGRGLADDGYSLFAALLAIEEAQRQGHALGRCVVLIEASEESGSPDLEPYLDSLADFLGNVTLLICLDSGALTYDRLWVTTSLRGMSQANVTVRVLERGQHSGAASGVVPSSFRILRHLMDRLEDSETGDIILPQLWADIPQSHRDAATSVAEEFGDVAAEHQPFASGVDPMGGDAAERILRHTWWPTLSTVGASGLPEVAIAGNVLRPFTTLAFSFRLPPTVKHDVAATAIRSALTHGIPHNAQIEIDIDGANGWVAPESAPWLAQALEAGSQIGFSQSPGFAGEGGSIPFLATLGERYPGVQFVATGVLGPKSNAHGIDEMLHLPTAVGVINAVAVILAAAARKENS